jgi:transcriptional regulator with XRE-family HTH domain
MENGMPKQSRCLSAMPAELKRQIKTIGERVRAARLRRGWTLADFASRIGVTPLTAARMEKGDPSVALGILITGIWILGLTTELKSFLSAEHDEIGRGMEARRSRQRARSTKEEKQNLDF